MKPKVRDDLAVADIDDELVIYDPEEDRPYHLNQSAAIAFRLCDGTGTAEEIAADVADVGGLPFDDVLDQFRHMVQHFEELGMIEGSVAVWNREAQAEQAQEGGSAEAGGTPHAHDHSEETPKDPGQLEEPETQNH